MKTIKRIEAAGYEVKALNYTHAASGFKIRRKGYAVCKEGKEIYTLEPCNSFWGEKWLLHSPTGLTWHKTIGGAVKSFL